MRPLAWVLFGIAGVLIVLVFVFGLIADLGVRSSLVTTRAQNVSLDSGLRTKATKLASTQAKVKELNHQIAKKSKNNAILRKDLLGTKKQVREARSSLDSATGQIASQSSQIQTLKTCLNGVTTSLNQLTYGYYNAAGRALLRVQASCQEADQILAYGD